MTLHVQLSSDGGEEGMCGLLRKAMYGTRDAAQKWVVDYSMFMLAVGFQMGKSSPCVFWNEEHNLRVVVHGDDFTILEERIRSRLVSREK